MTIQLDEAFTKKAVAMLRGGMPPDEVAWRLVPAYHRLDDPERQEVERVISMLRDR